MPDQAQLLRGMKERIGTGIPAGAIAAPRARSIALTSGKGGVGKSVLALNLAIALRRSGFRVCLLDASLGLGSLDLLCGLNAYWNLAHVVSGARTLADVIIEGPEQVALIPGASGLLDLADCSPAAQRGILAGLSMVEQTHDFLVIDTGPGIHEPVRRFALAAQTVCIVATPEPTAVADAYASVRVLAAGHPEVEPRLIINEADSPEQACEILARVQRTSRSFLNLAVTGLGYVPYDQAMRHAVSRQSPLLIDAPRAPAARAIEQLARRLAETVPAPVASRSFLSRFGSPAAMRVA